MKQNKLKVGLLGGSFNPVHEGHLHFAKEMQKALDLDEVWFIPARVSPHKVDEPPVGTEQRLDMLSKAIKDEPHYRVMDIECTMAGPSFTVVTLKRLTKEYPNNTFYLLIGDDVAKEFHKWKDPEEIIKLCNVAVGTRYTNGEDLRFSDDEIGRALSSHIIKIPILDVSSTKVRERLVNGKDCTGLVPPEVYTYIQQHKLYQES